jgi:hypothetical protein
MTALRQSYVVVEFSIQTGEDINTVLGAIRDTLKERGVVEHFTALEATSEEVGSPAERERRTARREQKPTTMESQPMTKLEGMRREEPEEEVVYISPRAFVKSMLAIAWSAFRHPLSPTTIDLSTGKYVHDA